MFIKNKHNKTAPSILDNDFPIKYSPINASIVKIINPISSSDLFLLTSILLLRRVIIPTINVMFKRLAPITLPKLSAGVLDTAEEIPTNSSGRDVAKAIIINATVNSDIFRNSAIFVSDFTKNIPETVKTIPASIK